MNEERRRVTESSHRSFWLSRQSCGKAALLLLTLSPLALASAEETTAPAAVETPAPAPAPESAPATPAPAAPAPGAPEGTPPVFRAPNAEVKPAPDAPVPPPAAATELPPSNPGELMPELPSQFFPPGINQLPPAVSPANPAAPEEMAPPPPDAKLLKYPVTQFHFKYGPNAALIPKLPPLEEITKVKVELGVIREGITAADRGKKKEVIDPNVKARRLYFGDAVLAINKAVVNELNQRGIYGVYVLPEATQVDATTGEDRRTNKKDFTLVIYVSEVKEVRTVTRRIPFRTTDKPIINDKAHARIREKSPIFATSETKPDSGLLRKQLLQNYLARVNRFPGRRVDAAVNASDEPGKITLDYLVREQKMWSGYLQTSNTGTESTGEWRTRIGAEIRQLANLDDTLRLEYTTSDFSRYQAASFSYEFAPIFPDYLKVRTYFSWGKYSSEDLGANLGSFEGQTFTTGGSVTWTPLYVRGYPVDITAGLEWQNISSSDETPVAAAATGNTSRGGETNFLLAFAGVGTERSTDKFTLATNVEFQANLAGLIGTDYGKTSTEVQRENDLADQGLPTHGNRHGTLDDLGRQRVDREFYIAKYNFLYSVYLEPLVFGKAWDEQKTWWKSTRAHELAFSAHGQTTFGDARLVPQLEAVAGGFSTVRGYPESFVVGDSSYVGSLEYRFHIPRALRPSDQAPQKPEAPAKKVAAKKGAPAAPATPPPAATEPAAPPPEKKFVFVPEHIGGSPDWDLIFRGFFDAGQTYNHDTGSSPFEKNRTLLGAGIGLELQILKPVFVSLRADWGFALHSETEGVNRPVSAGDSRFHLSATIAF